MNQKGFTLTLLLVAFLIISGGIIGGAIVIKNNLSNNPKPQTRITTSSNPSPVVSEPVSSTTTKISSEKALEIAKKNGFDATDLKVDEGIMYKSTGTTTINGIKTIRITSCSLNKTMNLNPETGQVLEFKSEVWCSKMDELTPEVASKIQPLPRPSDYKEIPLSQAKECALKFISDNKSKYKKLQYADMSTFNMSSGTNNCFNKEGRYCYYSQVNTKSIPDEGNKGYVVVTEVNAENCKVYTDPTINNF